jgi:hypothetical protein
MRLCVSTIFAILLIASNAFAGDGALAPGKPAGVKQAQTMDNSLIIELGMAAVTAGLAIALANGQHNTPTISAPSTTSP